MRRAERLFAILQVLRARRRAVTARELAEELEVSVRTVYRDTAELIAQRVPLRGDAGAGYRLDPRFELPPMMLTSDELEAAMLGAAWVSQRGDASLARAARSLIEKLAHVVPPELRSVLVDATLRPACLRRGAVDTVDVSAVRRAISERRKIEIAYVDLHGTETTRVVWPFLVAFMDEARAIAAHCELRGGFRHFRTDRIRAVQVLDARYPESHASIVARWEAQFPERAARRSG